MDIESKKLRASELREQLEYHSKRYHEDDDPEISDFEYDAMFRELCDIEAEFPELAAPDSPTRRVGGAVLSTLEPRAHSQRMYGLENVFSIGDWQAFAQRAQRAQEQA